MLLKDGLGSYIHQQILKMQSHNVVCINQLSLVMC